VVPISVVPVRRFVPGGRTGGSRLRAPDRVARRTRPAALRVGIWDLEVYAGFLPRVLTTLNEAQKVFAFEMVEAAVPRVISLGGEGTLAWARELLDEETFIRDRDELQNNVVAERIYTIAEQTRQKFQLDLLVLITPEMIAFAENGRVRDGYYSWSESKVVLVSAYEVRDFAKRGKRRFEVALASMMLAQILVALLHPQNPQIGFHFENRGCLFDFNDTRITLSQTLASMTIEPSCLREIPQPFRDAAERMVKLLRDYPR
jgi:hypothetical protein